MPLLRKLFSSLPRLALFGLAILAALLWFAVPRLLGEKVPVLTATKGELIQTVVASGKVRSPQRVELASQIGGRVIEIPVGEGQKVKAGQLLIRLDDDEWRAAAAQARAGLAQSDVRLAQMDALALPLALQAQRQAEANWAQARKNFERASELVAKGFYSRTQLDDARRNLDVTASQLQAAQLQARSSQPGGSDRRLAGIAVDQARAGLQVAQAKLAYTRISAPLDGTLLTRAVEPGDTVQAGKVLMTLSPAGDTELVAQIDEKNLSLLKPGLQAQASADAYPNQRFGAQISYISPAIDALRGSVEIRLRVDAPPDYLRQEMTVSIDIATARRPEAIIVPIEAIRDPAGPTPWALVVRDGTARRQAVKLGLRGDNKMEILDGLTAGEQLVAANNAAVRDGSRVRAIAR